MSRQYFVLRLLLLLMPFWIKICDGQTAWNETYAPWLGCMTQDGGEGRCLVWERCEYLNQRLRTFDEIEPHRCGFSGSVVMVCCPLTPGNNQSEFSDTRQPFLPDRCGITRSEIGRVAGGQIAEKGSWPWMSAVFHLIRGYKDFRCGGVLVTSNHVITVAHCVVRQNSAVPKDPTELVVSVGAHDLKDNETAIERSVTAVRIHEFFEHNSLRNDIAVLRLNQTVQFSDNILPVCLPYGRLRYTDIVGKVASVAGFGYWSYSGLHSKVLREVSFQIQNQDVCKNIYEYQITDKQLCAGTADGSKVTCLGDSGGPLVIIGEGERYYLVGIVSYGNTICSVAGYFGIYTRITQYLHWLTLNLAD